VSTIPELCDAISQSFTPRPDVYEVTQMYDYKSWLEPFTLQLSNHIYPHAFKFEEKEGTVQMFYKSWASDELWLPNEDSGLVVLSSVPTGRPSLLRPDYKKSLEILELANKVEKCHVRLDICQRGCWREYLSSEQEMRKLWSSASEEQLLEMGKEGWFISLLSPFSQKDLRENSLPGENETDMDGKLAMLVEKVNKFPEVVL